MPRSIKLSPAATEQLQRWISQEPKLAKKIFEFLLEAARTPTEGKGKPEGLRHNLKGCWSRRITDEH